MSYYLDAHKYIACQAWNSSDSWELNSFAFFFSFLSFRLNCWHSMYWTWRNMIKTMTLEIVPALSANSLCPLIRAVLFTNTPRSFSLHSSLPPSWSLHLKVKVFILVLVNYKNPDLHANLSTFLLLRLLGPSGKNLRSRRQLEISFVIFFISLQTEITSSWGHYLICWTLKPADTRSCPTGPNRRPTRPCATWRWRILCVQGEQFWQGQRAQGCFSYRPPEGAPTCKTSQRNAPNHWQKKNTLRSITFISLTFLVH